MECIIVRVGATRRRRAPNDVGQSWYTASMCRCCNNSHDDPWLSYRYLYSIGVPVGRKPEAARRSHFGAGRIALCPDYTVGSIKEFGTAPATSEQLWNTVMTMTMEASRNIAGPTMVVEVAVTDRTLGSTNTSFSNRTYCLPFFSRTYMGRSKETYAGVPK
jgi:hypothetical protein